MNQQNRFLMSVVVGTLVVGCTSKDGSDKARAGMDHNRGSIANDAQEDGDFNKKDAVVTADTRYAAGQLAESRGATSVALQQYEQALKLDKNHAPSLYRIGVIYTNQRQITDAIAAWERYIAAVPNPAAGYCNLAVTYILAEQPADAEKAFKKGLEIEPANKGCRINYGLMLARQNRVSEATTQLSAVMKPAEVHFRLGGVLEQQGDRVGAKREYQAALASDPSLKDAQVRISAME